MSLNKKLLVSIASNCEPLSSVESKLFITNSFYFWAISKSYFKILFFNKNDVWKRNAGCLSSDPHPFSSLGVDVATKPLWRPPPGAPVFSSPAVLPGCCRFSSLMTTWSDLADIGPNDLLLVQVSLHVPILSCPGGSIPFLQKACPAKTTGWCLSIRMKV